MNCNLVIENQTLSFILIVFDNLRYLGEFNRKHFGDNEERTTNHYICPLTIN